MLREKKNIILLVLLNVFFIDYILVFWSYEILSLIVQSILLFSIPCCALIFRNDSLKLQVQMLSINLLLGAIWLCGILNPETARWRSTLIVWSGLCLFGGIIIYLFTFIKKLQLQTILSFIRDYLGAIAVCILFILFSLETITDIPAFDGGIYYTYINGQDATFDFSIIRIALHSRLAGHMSIGYGLFTLLGELISQRTIGLHIINILLASLSIMAYFDMLKTLFPSKKSGVRTLATAVYACSPFMLGMVGTINIDMAGVYFLIIILDCYINHYWFLELFFSWAYLCTKEPNAVYYSFFLLGILIYHFMLKAKENRFKKDTFKELFSFIIPRGLLLFWWLFCFLKSVFTSWVTSEFSELVGDGLHRFGFSIQNLIIKLKQTWFINFNWIFTVLILAGAVFFAVRRRQLQSKKAFFPLITTLIGFFIFQFIYIDNIHPRYIAVGAIVVTIMGSFTLLEALSDNKNCICFIVLALLLAVQSYISLDPITPKMYENRTRFDDTVIYNREYSYHFKAVSRALETAGYEENSIVVLPGFASTIGQYGYNDIMFWNPITARLEAGATNDSIPFKVGRSMEEIKEFDRVIYIVPFYLPEDENILQNLKIENEFEAKYRTRSVKCYVGRFSPAHDA